jgi:signal transduction histidine kinase
VAVSTCQLRIQRLDGEVYSVIMKSTPRGDDVHVALLDETARLRAEAELRALAEHLEERVAERTAEAERHAQELAASQALLRAREAELRQAQKMHAIGRLASGVAHEFNNLLMGIMGSADMCLDALDPKSDVAVMLRRLRESASGGAEIVKQLLLFSRKEDEAGTSSPDAVLEANERLLRKTVGEDVDLRVMLGAPRLFVPCSSVWLGQILLNLAMNARQAMPKGGKLTIQTQVLAIAGGVTGTLSSLPAGDYLALQVRDTGVGMDEATRSRAFEPFFTTKAIGEGTGIGLSTVYGIVDRAGGRVFIDSEVGIGTVVTVVLPVTESFEEAAPRSRAVSAYELDGLTALVVEDEPLVREALRHYLESAGMNVIEAPDGEEALSLYREHEPSIDLVVTDIALPKMAGDELARMVRKPLLCVSAYSTVDLRRQGRLLPNVRTLQKPFAVNDLLEAVRKTLGP